MNALSAASAAGHATTARRARLEEVLRERLRAIPPTATDGGGITWPVIVPDPARRFEPFPLTSIQQAYWLGRNPGFELGGVGIHGYFEMRCRHLDVPRLTRAWQSVVQRHDMLRAVIQPDGQQRILDEVPPYEIAVVDLRRAAAADVDATLHQLRDHMSHQVFALDTWPLFEIVALRHDDEWTRLLFSEDAIHVDLVSSALILDDWLRLYRDPELTLPPLDLSYRDYVLALEQLRGTPMHGSAMQYWRDRVEHLPPPPDLPRVRCDGPPRFERMQFTLPPAAWRAIRDRAGAEHLSTSAVLLAVYAEVLGHWSSAPRLSLNVTVYNRLPLHPQVAQIAGDFTSMALLEVDRTHPLAFIERATTIQRQLWADLEHHSVNGVEILRELAARRGGSGALMPYVFTGSLGNTGYRALEQLGTIEYAVTQTPQVLIDQQVFEEEGRLVLSWDVVASAFPPGMAAEMFAYGRAIVERLADEPDYWQQRIRPPGAHRATVTVSAPTGLLHEYFDRRSMEAAHRVAVVDDGGAVTYGELTACTNRMARRLRACGTKPDRPVGVLASRGWEAIAAALAIGKAGAPYLPLDPAWPPERLRQIIQDASVDLVVADRADATAQMGLRTLTFQDVADESAAALVSVQTPANLAYVMYTSGSTGVPKGVLIEQHSVVHRMCDVVERFGLSVEDTAFAVTALHHDLSVFDIFGMLAVAGGSVVVPGSGYDPSRWAELLASNGVTVWNSVPAFMEMFIRATRFTGTQIGSVRAVMLSGDRIRPQLIGEIRQLLPQARVFSLGGPTETTVWDIWHPITDEDATVERVPYGVPLANADYYVLKTNLDECPIWTPGELCISGAGLARGYLNRPDLTSERFVFHPDTGERLYRSGDIGRRLPTGEIDILGRCDRQVKIRGHRIELDEVEATLARAPGVAAATVEVDGAGASADLVAYVVPSGNDVADTEISLGERNVPQELSVTCARRRSHRQYLDELVERDSLAMLLGSLADYSAAGAVLPRHLYPSAGTQYAVHTYLHVKPGRVDGISDGWHLYDAQRHILTLVSRDPLPVSAHHERNGDIVSGCAFSILLVADMTAMRNVYPEWARDFCLIEAGAMSQLLMMAAGSVGLGLCPIGGIENDAVATPLSLGPDRQLLHSLCGGRVAPSTAALHDGGVTRDRSSGQIRAWLSQRLPRHMVPKQIVMIDRLPLSSNGKIDRAALASARRASVQQTPAASESLVGVIRQCWASVLGRTVADDEHLFDSGVDSFQTVRAWPKIRQRTQLDFELVEMFRNPTPAALAAHLAGAVSRPEVAGQQRGAARRRAREQRGT